MAATPRPLLVFAIVIGVCAGLIILMMLLLALFVRSEAFEAQVKESVLPMVSERLGREVKVSDIKGRVLPSPRVRVTGVRVTGRTDIPTFTCNSIEAGLRIWPLLTSRGRRIVLDRLDFKAPTTNLVRLASGEWDLPHPPPSKRRVEFDLEDIRFSEGSFNLFGPGGRPLLGIASISGSASFIASAFELRTLQGEAYGARFDAGGSRIDLGSEPILWSFEAAVDDLLLEDLPSRIQPLSGNLDFQVDLAGEDLRPNRVGRTATGAGAFQADKLVWRTLDLGRAIAESLGGLLEEAGLAVVPYGRPPAETSLGRLERSVRIRNGWVELEEPVRFDSPAGRSRIGGRWRLGSQLDLEAQTQLRPEFVSTLTQGELVPDEPVPIRYRIRGSFADPRIEQIDASAFLPLLAEEGARRLRRGLERILPPLGTETAPTP